MEDETGGICRNLKVFVTGFTDLGKALYSAHIFISNIFKLFFHFKPTRHFTLLKLDADHLLDSLPYGLW